MSFGKVSSFFMKNEEISYIRVLIALSLSQILLFGFGYLLYFIYNYDFTELFFSFLTEEILKNSIIMSTFFYFIILYLIVRDYNKPITKKESVRKITGIRFLSIMLGLYSVYMIIDVGLLNLRIDALIKNHYYFYTTYLMAICNFALILFLLVVFMDDKLDYKHILQSKRGFYEAISITILYVFTAIILNIIFKELFLSIYNYITGLAKSEYSRDFISMFGLIIYLIVFIGLNLCHFLLVVESMGEKIIKPLKKKNKNRIPSKDFEENEVINES